jgi:hypothetical protein
MFVGRFFVDKFNYPKQSRLKSFFSQRRVPNFGCKRAAPFQPTPGLADELILARPTLFAKISGATRINHQTFILWDASTTTSSKPSGARRSSN